MAVVRNRSMILKNKRILHNDSLPPFNVYLYVDNNLVLIWRTSFAPSGSNPDVTILSDSDKEDKAE